MPWRSAGACGHNTLSEISLDGANVRWYEFVGTRTVVTWVLTVTGVFLTVFEAVRVARTEGLATAVGPNGTLRAYVGAPSPG